MGQTDGETDSHTHGVKHPSRNTLRSASALLNAGERIKSYIGKNELLSLPDPTQPTKTLFALNIL